MLYGLFWSSGSREPEGPCCSAAVSRSWRAMVAYLMAVVSSIPNTAARWRGSAPQVSFFELPVDAEPFEGGREAAA